MTSSSKQTPGRVTNPPATEPEKSAGPWWRERMLWLVVGGPLAVVLASLATLLIALRHPDPVISGGGADAQVPAVQARNQAAARAARP